MALRSRKKSRDDSPEEPERPDQEGSEEDLPEAVVLTELEEAQHARDEYLESWTRARADYQNLRRRLQSDIDSSVGRAKENLLLELLLVLDFLDMALKTPVETQDAKNLLMGVEMTRGQMLQLLEREAVKPVAHVGTFDPDKHEAMEVVAHDEIPEGEIVETIRAGYSIGDRMLRHAHVKVSGEPEPPEGDDEDKDEAES